MSIFKIGSAKHDVAGGGVTSIGVKEEEARSYTRFITCGASKANMDLAEQEPEEKYH